MSQPRRSARLEGSQQTKVVTPADFGEWEDPAGVSDDDDDGDFEIQTKKSATPAPRKKRRLSPKKPAKRRAEAPAPRMDIDSEGDMFDEIQQSAVKVVVDQWVELYIADRDEAVVKLVNFIFKSCGSSASISVNDIGDRDREDILAEVQECCEEDEKSFPIDLKDKSKRKTFKSRFVEFWFKLVVKLKSSILFDDHLLPTTIDWLSAIASAELRPLRMTATLATFQIVSGLVKAAVDFQSDLLLATENLEKERSKRKPLQRRVKQFEDDMSDLNKKLETVHTLMKTCFNTVFVHRFRDVAEEIRKLCIVSLGNWMQKYPTAFLADQKLKYVGWCLNDKERVVRKSSLDVLCKLYKSPENVAQLSGFTERFLPRLLEMTRDKDDETACQAIRLVTELLRLDLLEEDDGSDIQTYIWDTNPSVRNVSARFVSQDVFGTIDDDKSLDEKQKARLDLTELVNIFANYVNDQVSDEKRGQYFVDSLWDKVECLHKWEMYASFLLETELLETERKSDEDEEPQLSENHKVMLVQILLAAAQKANNKLTIAETRKGRPKAVSGAQKEKEKKIRASFSECFLTELPKLLTVFQADELKLNSLVQLVMYLNLEEFPMRRQKKHFSTLIKKLRDIFLKHTSVPLLNHTMESCAYLCNTEHIWKDDANRITQSIASELHSKLSDLLQSDEENVNDSIVECLNRIYACCRQLHFPELDFTSEHERLLESSVLDDGDDQIAESLLQLSMADFLWALMKFVRADEADMQDESTKLLAKKRHSLLSHLEYVLENASFKLKTVAFSLTCDTLTSSKCTLLGDRDATDSLSTIDKGLLSLCEKFLKDFFGDDENALSADEEKKMGTAWNIIVSTCKLCLINPDQFQVLSAIVIAQYTRYEQRHDEVIKFFMQNLKHKSSASLQTAQLLALIHVYEVSTSQDVELLAKRFVLTHGMDSGQRSFVDFVKQGITYGLTEAPSRGGFLDCALIPFIKRSNLRQKQQMLGHFMAERAALKDPEQIEEEENAEWDVLFDFQSRLRKIVDTGSGASKRPLELALVGSGVKKPVEDVESHMDDMDTSPSEDDKPIETDDQMSSPIQSPQKKKRAKRARKAQTDADGWVSKSKSIKKSRLR